MGVFDYEVNHVLGATYSGGGVGFTPDGNKLAVALYGRVQMIDLVGGKSRTLCTEAGRSIKALEVRSNVVLTVDEADRVTLLRTPSGRAIARMTLHLKGPVTATALSPCGQFVAFASASMVQVWQVPASGVPEYAAFEKITQLMAGGAAGKGCLAWSRDSRRLAVGGRDGICFVFTVRRREGAKGRIRPLVLHGHRDAMTHVSFCGQRGLLTISRDGVLICWRLRFTDITPEAGNSKEPQSSEATDGVVAVDSEDEEQQASGDASIDNRFVKPVRAKMASRHFVKSGGGRRVRSASTRNGLLTVGMSNGVFALYQLPEAMVDETTEFDDGLFDLGVQAAKRRRESQISRRAKRRKESGNCDSADAAEGGDESDPEDTGLEETPRMPITELDTLHTLNASAGTISDIEFNPSGEWIVLASSHAGQITVWEWRSETHVLKQQAHVLSASSLAFSRDGRGMCTGSRDGRVKLWSVATGFCAATFFDHTAAVSAVTFAANDVIVSASLDGTVRAFDIRRYRNFRILVAPPPQRQFGALAVDEAGELVAAGCVDTFEVIVWSLRTGEVVEVLAGHKGPVSSIAFRPQRGTLASASWDRTVRLWDMYERKGSCEVLEHSKEVLSVAFRPDGKELATASMSGEVSFWDPEQGSVVGTIDGARDAAAGRQRDSRTVAPEKGYFQTLSYSSDGHFLLAGAASKHVCIYHVREGSPPTLVDKYAVTDNKNFDGLLDELNSKNQTASGHAVEAVDDDDEDDETYGEAKIAAGRSLPGAQSELKTKRKKMIVAEVKCVQFCPTGRMWGAVSPEGALIFSEAGAANADDTDVAFDPTNLDVEVTSQTALAAVKEGDFRKALVIALRLNERGVLSRVLESVPYAQIAAIAPRLPTAHFVRLVHTVSWRIEHTPYLDFDLEWARRLLTSHASAAHAAAPQPAKVNTALRALHRAVGLHSKRLLPLVSRNTDSLRYLVALSKASRVGGHGVGTEQDDTAQIEVSD